MAGQNKLSVMLSPEFSRDSLEALRRDVSSVLSYLPAHVDLSISGGAISVSNDLDEILGRFKGVLESTASSMRYSFSEAVRSANAIARESMDGMIFTAEAASKSIVNAAVERADRISSKISSDVQEYRRLIDEAAGVNVRLYESGDKPGVNSAAVNSAMEQVGYFAKGGYVPSTPGGRHVVVAEGGEGEYIVPESKVEEFVRERGRGGVNEAMRGATQTTAGGSSQAITVEVVMQDANAVHAGWNGQSTETASTQTWGPTDPGATWSESVSGRSQDQTSRHMREISIDRSEKISDTMGADYAKVYMEKMEKNQEDAYRFYKSVMEAYANNLKGISYADYSMDRGYQIYRNLGDSEAERYRSLRKSNPTRAYMMYEESRKKWSGSNSPVSGVNEEEKPKESGGQVDFADLVALAETADWSGRKVAKDYTKSQDVKFADVAALAGGADWSDKTSDDELKDKRSNWRYMISNPRDPQFGALSKAYGFVSGKWDSFKSGLTSDFGNTEDEREKNVKKSTSQVKAIDSVVQGGFNIVTGLMKFSVNLFQSIFKKLKEASPFLQTIEELFNTAVNIILMPLGNLIAEEILPIALDMIDKATDIWDIVDETVGGSDGGNLGAVFSKVIDHAISTVSGFITGIGSTLKDEGGLVGAIGEALETVGKFLEENGVQMLTMMIQIGTFVISHFKELISLAVAFAVMHQGLMYTLIATTAASGALLSGGTSVAIAGIGTGISIGVGAFAGEQTYLKLDGNKDNMFDSTGTISGGIGDFTGWIGDSVKLAEGGHVEPLPGGTRAIIGEGGEAEDVVPEHKKLGYALSVLTDHAKSYSPDDKADVQRTSQASHAEYSSVSNGGNITLTINGATTDEIKDYIREYVDGQIRQSRYRSGF